MDGDATADVIVNGTDLMWYDNDGAGEFTAMNLGASPASDILLADTDNDTDPDLVFAQDPDVNVRLNNGSGSFGTSSQLIAPISSTNRVRGLHAKDIEGDGDMDVVYWLGGLVSDVDRLIHGINTGAAQFTMVGYVEAEAISADNPFPFAIGDADGNPLNDVVAVANDGIYLRSDVVQVRHLLTSVDIPTFSDHNPRRWFLHSVRCRALRRGCRWRSGLRLEPWRIPDDHGARLTFLELEFR